MKKIIVFTGFTFIFTLLSYYVVHVLMVFAIGKRDESIEIEKENHGYFIIKGVLLVLLTFSLITVFQHFLGWFTLKIDTPFYH